MSHVLSISALVFVVALALMSSGCESKKASDQPAASAPINSVETDGPQSDMERELAKLPEGDRELALAQKVCPVSGEPLGSMGTPIKVTVEGRDVFVCCAGCVDELKSNFDKYADKLEKQL
jgi:hypothetical protein